MSLDEKYIQEAADRIMIQDLLARYAFETDYGTGNPDAWAALFVEEGRFEIPEISLIAAGRPALRKFIDGLHKSVPGLHHIMSNYVIDIDGDRARGKVELNEFMLRPEAIYNNLHGWYDDDYVRVNDRWLIEVRRVHLPDDTITVVTNGKIGEYFKEYFERAQEFITA